MIKALFKGIKLLGQAKAALEAVDDDVDLDGKSEVDELKESFDELRRLVGEVITETKVFYGLVVLLVEHVAKAARGKKEDQK